MSYRVDEHGPVVDDGDRHRPIELRPKRPIAGKAGRGVEHADAVERGAEERAVGRESEVEALIRERCATLPLDDARRGHDVGDALTTGRVEPAHAIREEVVVGELRTQRDRAHEGQRGSVEDVDPVLGRHGDVILVQHCDAVVQPALA